PGSNGNPSAHADSVADGRLVPPELIRRNRHYSRPPMSSQTAPRRTINVEGGTRRSASVRAEFQVYSTHAFAHDVGWEVSKPKILSTRPLFLEARAILDRHFDVEYRQPGERISRADLLKRVSDKEGLVCLLTEKVDEELLSTAPKLRIAATVSVGF